MNRFKNSIVGMNEHEQNANIFFLIKTILHKKFFFFFWKLHQSHEGGKNVRMVSSLFKS